MRRFVDDLVGRPLALYDYKVAEPSFPRPASAFGPGVP